MEKPCYNAARIIFLSWALLGPAAATRERRGGFFSPGINVHEKQGSARRRGNPLSRCPALTLVRKLLAWVDRVRRPDAVLGRDGVPVNAKRCADAAKRVAALYGVDA